MPGSQNPVPPTSPPPSYLYACLQETLSIHALERRIRREDTLHLLPTKTASASQLQTSNLRKDFVTLLPVNIQGGAETSKRHQNAPLDGAHFLNRHQRLIYWIQEKMTVVAGGGGGAVETGERRNQFLAEKIIYD